jgi:hypothetical protein
MDQYGDRIRRIRQEPDPPEELRPRRPGETLRPEPNLFEEEEAYRRRRAAAQRVRHAIMTEDVQKLRRANPTSGIRKRSSPSDT